MYENQSIICKLYTVLNIKQSRKINIFSNFSLILLYEVYQDQGSCQICGYCTQLWFLLPLVRHFCYRLSLGQTTQRYYTFYFYIFQRFSIDQVPSGDHKTQIEDSEEYTEETGFDYNDEEEEKRSVDFMHRHFKKPTLGAAVVNDAEVDVNQNEHTRKDTNGEEKSEIISIKNHDGWTGDKLFIRRTILKRG